jgi:Putative zinc-finger
MNAVVQHTDVGAYALGLLEEPDRLAFERHLAACTSCQEELGALRGLAATLEGLPLAEEPMPPSPPDPALVSDLLQRRRKLDRRRRVSQALVGVAAGVVLMAGSAGLGITVGADRGEEVPPPVERPVDTGVDALFRNARPVSATDSGTGISGTVAMQRKQWGSVVGLRLTKVRGPLQCELVAVDRAGREHTVSGWSVPAKGYGFSDSSMPELTLQGGTALSPSEISRFEVRTIGGARTLLTVPIT